MRKSRCAARCDGGHPLSRRAFLGASACLVGSAVLGGCAPQADRPAAGPAPVRPCGPASTCAPTLRAAFVRRKGPYGMWWPGAVYDGEAARAAYTRTIRQTADGLGMKLDLRPEPIFSNEEADAWVAESKAAKPDGLVVVVLDRQQHAWPTVAKAVDSGLPTVVFSPLGTSFTTNTAGPSKKPGCVIYSTDDPGQLAYGVRMIWAGAKMRATRCVVLAGNERRDTQLADLGIALRYVPAREFLDEYNRTAAGADILAMADDYLRRARRVSGATRQDVVNGVKSYAVARAILEREQGDAITMDCLGALGRTPVSLPCIAWSRMNDAGVPAACEADLGAVATHTIVQYLFGRPGFQQDPVAETSRQAIIGAHCSCPTRLGGFDAPPEPFDICHHHGNRDAVPRTLWRVGQRVTSADVLPGNPSKVLIAAGRVLANVDVPPAGGCVVSVMVAFDDMADVLTWPGFHQIFFYGDYKRHLVEFCRLFRLEPEIV